MAKKINGMLQERYLACEILTHFEDFLESKGIKIKNKEREDYPLNSLTCPAILFGSEYYSLEDELTEIITKHNKKIKKINCPSSVKHSLRKQYKLLL